LLNELAKRIDISPQLDDYPLLNSLGLSPSLLYELVLSFSKKSDLNSLEFDFIQNIIAIIKQSNALKPAS